PMPWWHENYIEPLDLYFHFTAIANFVRGLPFGTARWEQVPVAAVEYQTPPNPPIVRDAVLVPVNRWARPAVNEFVVQPDGTVNDPGELLDLLHGDGHADLRHPPTFVVNYPRAGKFIVSVGRVSNSGLLKIWVDDRLVLEREFPCGENIGKEWRYLPQYTLWESVYDEDVSVDVAAGTHRIRVENLGKDWMRILRYVFTGCKVVDRPDLLVAALRTQPGNQAIAWIQNRESDWFNHGQGKVPPVPPSRVVLEGFADGAYQVEWWETWLGKPARTQRVTAAGGRLELRLEALQTDTAAKIRRIP
ncbi:MAG: hypothetical protein QHJ73_20160, partial [Armatimonadota bacterium]|nr:hypothetical protein [Armatimonadota bacterium]